MNIITVTEAAKISGVTVSYVRRLLREGTIHGTKLGQSCWILEKSEAEKIGKNKAFCVADKKSSKKT
jgi:excisionase family DNA binding protein